MGMSSGSGAEWWQPNENERDVRIGRREPREVAGLPNVSEQLRYFIVNRSQ